MLIEGVNYVKLSEISKTYGYSESHLRRLARDHKQDCGARRILGRWYANPEAFKQFIFHHAEEKPEKARPDAEERGNFFDDL